MENVPDILNHGGHNIAEEISEVLESRGYRCGYTLLNAARYGVPQMRERMFLIAYRKELQQSVEFPKPTHWVDLPAGYEGSRAVALKLLSKDLFSESARYIPAPEAGRDLEPAVTAKQAIEDLPTIYARELLADGLLTRGARRLNIPVAFIRPRSISRYAEQMRSWAGFPAKASLYDHVIRYLPRDYELFSRLQPGDQYPQAYACALKMFDEKLALLRKKKAAPQPGTAAWRRLRDSIVPPYDPDKFPNKWRKMEEDWPARTLMAHLGKDSYSHIHYDSEQGRTISVREAARLQSFPDGFVFSGTMNPAFRQIGNAVPEPQSDYIRNLFGKKAAKEGEHALEYIKRLITQNDQDAKNNSGGGARPPTMFAVLRALRIVEGKLSAMRNSSEMMRRSSKLKNLTFEPLPNPFSEPEKIIRPGQTSILYLGGYDQLTQCSIAAITLETLFDFRALLSERISPFFTVIEEAHTFIPSTREKTDDAVSLPVFAGSSLRAANSVRGSC